MTGGEGPITYIASGLPVGLVSSMQTVAAPVQGLKRVRSVELLPLLAATPVPSQSLHLMRIPLTGTGDQATLSFDITVVGTEAVQITSTPSTLTESTLNNATLDCRPWRMRHMRVQEIVDSSWIPQLPDLPSPMLQEQRPAVRQQR